MYCQVFLRAALPGTYMDCILFSATIFLTTMGNSLLPLMIQVAQICFHIFFMFLVNRWDAGLVGTAYAYDLTKFCSLLIYIIVFRHYIYKTGHLFNQVMVRISRDVFFDYGSFVSLACSALLIYCFEEWAQEGLQLMSGVIGIVN